MPHLGIAPHRPVVEHVSRNIQLSLPFPPPPRGFNPSHVHCPCEIAFLVLTRSPCFLWLALTLQSKTILGFSMDVDFVLSYTAGLTVRAGWRAGIRQGIQRLFSIQHSPHGNPRALTRGRGLPARLGISGQGSTHGPPHECECPFSFRHHGLDEQFSRSGRAERTHYSFLRLRTARSDEPAQEIHRYLFD